MAVVLLFPEKRREIQLPAAKTEQCSEKLGREAESLCIQQGYRLATDEDYRLSTCIGDHSFE